MSYTQAWALLDRARNGESVPLADINTALGLTGGLPMAKARELMKAAA